MHAETPGKESVAATEDSIGIVPCQKGDHENEILRASAGPGAAPEMGATQVRPKLRPLTLILERVDVKQERVDVKQDGGNAKPQHQGESRFTCTLITSKSIDYTKEDEKMKVRANYELRLF